MQTIIPAIMLLSVIWIIYQLAKDKERDLQAKLKDDKFRYSIEHKVYNTIKEKADYWDNFNIELYVKFLESR